MDKKEEWKQENYKNQQNLDEVIRFGPEGFQHKIKENRKLHK